MARLIDDFENQGLAALPDALQVSELRRAEGFLLLFDIFLLIIFKSSSLMSSFTVLNALMRVRSYSVDYFTTGVEPPM